MKKKYNLDGGIFNIDLGYFYADLPKTASRTMIAVLEKYYAGVKYNSSNHSCIIPKLNDLFVWTVVRDPYSRVVSLWWSVNTAGDYYGWKEYSPDIVSMLKWIMSGGVEKSETRYAPDLHHTLSQNLDMKEIKPTMFLKYENLEESFKALYFHNGTPEELPVLNKKSALRKADEEYLTADAIDLINIWAREDFERFGYEMRKI